MNNPHWIAAIATAALICSPAWAQETKISHEPVQKNGLIISAAYLGSEHLAMAPMLPGMHASADIHLETDIFADNDFKQGLQPGTWVSYLNITYRMTKKGSDWSTFGAYMPMAASDGFHYGNNVKLDGPGTYALTLHIEPPPYSGFMRHTDDEIGVPEWWDPFDVSWTFDWPAQASTKK